MNKTRRNFTLTDEAHRLLKQIARRKGISMSAVVELLAREEAEREGIERQIEPEETLEG